MFNLQRQFYTGLAGGIAFSLLSITAVITYTKKEQSVYEIYPDKSDHAYWAQQVIGGGLLLLFRHAQREKWADVTVFDAIELHGKMDASKESFSKATCLTPRGVEQAKLIGAVFKILSVNVASVVSSPSCRARQTSLHAFGREGEISNYLFHRTALKQTQHAEAAKGLRKLIASINVPENSNVVLSGHGGTLGFDGKAVIDDYRASVKIDSRDEGGFAVMEYKNGKVIVHHVFTKFSQFANEAITLPLRP